MFRHIVDVSFPGTFPNTSSVSVSLEIETYPLYKKDCNLKDKHILKYIKSYRNVVLKINQLTKLVCMHGNKTVAYMTCIRSHIYTPPIAKAILLFGFLQAI